MNPIEEKRHGRLWTGSRRGLPDSGVCEFHRRDRRLNFATYFSSHLDDVLIPSNVAHRVARKSNDSLIFEREPRFSTKV